ncbi:transglutaminase-like cysteine peptidase [Marinobacterium lutimaris]|uniref:Predicted transglutaminase-like cysteine proteinase n=1 Tax=Marinobacterium lutimaris TaxID=568106 RepID=A0A1H5YTM5_9GAMM|nr:transglutaminase-like cysteine peptidase [Marinobacterium lutimaris]SEG27318.1 Predicted transglutaminase-like cysteine proteinase [Marinobacterium lutimaris]
MNLTLKPCRRLGRRALGALSLGLGLALSLSPQASFAKGLVEFSPALLSRVEAKFGRGAVMRLNALKDLADNNQSATEMDKVKAVNDFFNQVPYYTDPVHWKMKDYWATPFEKLTTYGGDCEDYAIGKYFTLRELGVPDDRMRIMYVKALDWGEAHMVLTYFPQPRSIPLVLDNLKPQILPANQRKDLVPVYSFNADSLWLAKERGVGKRVGSSSKLGLWTDLQKRIDQ